MRSHHFFAIAFVFVAAAVQAAEVSEPIDRTSTPGSRSPEVEQRVRTADQVKHAENNKKRSTGKLSEVVATALNRADLLLKDGNPSSAAEAYQELLMDSMERLTATPQSLTDCFLVCFSSVRAVEVLELKGERALARRLCDYTRKTLRLCRETMPEWNPAIVEYRLRKVEEKFAKLQ